MPFRLEMNIAVQEFEEYGIGEGINEIGLGIIELGISLVFRGWYWFRALKRKRGW